MISEVQDACAKVGSISYAPDFYKWILCFVGFNDGEMILNNVGPLASQVVDSHGWIHEEYMASVIRIQEHILNTTWSPHLCKNGFVHQLTKEFCTSDGYRITVERIKKRRTPLPQEVLVKA